MGQGKRPDQIKYSTMAAGWSIIGIIVLILLSVMYFGAALRRRGPEEVQKVLN